MPGKSAFALILVCIALPAILWNACSSEAGLDYQRYYVNGKGIYEKNCQGCHGAKGEGLAQLYPPLTDTTFLKVNRNKLACIVRYGQLGGETLRGRKYDGQMPGNDHLPDIDIAQVIVYITNSFGNQQGFYHANEATADLKLCR